MPPEAAGRRAQGGRHPSRRRRRCCGRPSHHGSSSQRGAHRPFVALLRPLQQQQRPAGRAGHPRGARREGPALPPPRRPLVPVRRCPQCGERERHHRLPSPAVVPLERSAGEGSSAGGGQAGGGGGGGGEGSVVCAPRAVGAAVLCGNGDGGEGEWDGSGGGGGGGGRMDRRRGVERGGGLERGGGGRGLGVGGERRGTYVHWRDRRWRVLVLLLWRANV